jgi:hypothetical protein
MPGFVESDAAELREVDPMLLVGVHVAGKRAIAYRTLRMMAEAEVGNATP